MACMAPTAAAPDLIHELYSMYSCMYFQYCWTCKEQNKPPDLIQIRKEKYSSQNLIPYAVC